MSGVMMTIIEIAVLKKPVTATIDIPGSKSYTNRALVIAALTKGKVTLHYPLYSEDTEVMVTCLRRLGIRIERLRDQLIVYDDISMIQESSCELFAQDSGTTVRFLLALLCLIPGNQVIKGNARLNERPIKDLVEALRFLGAKIDYLEKEEELPIKVNSSSLYLGSRVVLDASISSQFLSALLMIAPLLEGLTISLQGSLHSKPYVEMTLHLMQRGGIRVEKKDKSYYIPPGQDYQKQEYLIEGDFSSAAYFFAIAALTQSTFTLKNLNPYSFQADRKFLDILVEMGNEVEKRENEITLIGKQIVPLSIEMQDCPDQVQTMAVLAAFVKGVVKISGVGSLRFKETDRVRALINELAKMGIQTEEKEDSLVIYGGNPKAALIDTYGDHRMAMAFAVAGTKLPGMRIHHPEVVNKTFPLFWDKLGSL